MPATMNPPTVRATAFDCPHCGAFAAQTWSEVYSAAIRAEPRTPVFPDEARTKRMLEDDDLSQEDKATCMAMIERMNSGLVSLEHSSRYSGDDLMVLNLHLNQCFNCKKVAVWVHEGLVFPPRRMGPEANQDLAPDILHDFEEARSILNSSPRGAAALLRLCIQKLCAQLLGGNGQDLDADIGRLVAKGLTPQVEHALDVVRVVGNEAVHPGTMDLRDDRDTAVRLLELVNLIADQCISHPKAAADMYAKLPETKREAIERRNAKARGDVKL